MVQYQKGSLMNEVSMENIIQEKLFALRDEKFSKFQRRLMPTVSPETVIGVRTPAIRELVKEIKGTDEARSFIKDLPHEYFDENQLHALLLSQESEYETCIEHVEKFLPYIDNWATCDQLSPKIFKKHRRELLKRIQRWINSKEVYTVRFGIGMLKRHFLDEDFDEKHLKLVAGVDSGEYYIKMMVAWYFATALAKHWDSAVKFIEAGELDRWTHNKSIRKATESYRVPLEHKEYLKTLRIKTGCDF